MAGTLEKLHQAILGGDDEQAEALARKALDEGYQPEAIFKEVLGPTLQEVGQLWKEGKVYMPEAVVSIDTFQIVKGMIEASHGKKAETVGKVVIGTVAGNVHTLGKKMIIGMLEASGFEVINLGENVAAPTFVETVRQARPDILGLGCYTTNAIFSLRTVFEALKASGLRDGVRVILGGEATSQELADELGADAWAKDVLDTVEKVARLMA